MRNVYLAAPGYDGAIHADEWQKAESFIKSIGLKVAESWKDGFDAVLADLRFTKKADQELLDKIKIASDMGKPVALLVESLDNMSEDVLCMCLAGKCADNHSNTEKDACQGLRIGRSCAAFGSTQEAGEWLWEQVFW